MNIANQLNLLLYTNKIGFTLFCIDNFSKIKLNKLFKYENTLNDDKISQLVESSYAFGYKLINDELIQNKKQITVEAIKGCDNSKEHVTEYLICITKFIATDYSLKVLEQNGKVKYFANCEKKTLKIFSFNT